MLREPRMRFILRGQDAVWYYQDRAHSHVLVDPDALSRSQAPGFVRPVELWAARPWSRPPTAPVVRYAQLFGSLVSLEDEEPRPGGHVVDRARVVDFIADPAFQLGALGALMDAVAAATAGGPPVVLVAPSVDAGMRWIGLVTFLAPPPVSLRVSFSSYERLSDVMARARAEAGGEGDLISDALQEDDPEGWRTPVVSVVLEDDVDSGRGLPRGEELPVVVVDPRIEATLVASGGSAHRRTHLGQRIRVTDWSRLALDAVCEESGALERCLRRLDEISLSTPPAGGPRGDWWPGHAGAAADAGGAAWFLAAAVALTPGLPLALPTATRIILRDTPPGLQLSDDLAAALAALVAATVDDAEQAWTRLVSARESDPPRPALVQAAFESYLYLSFEDDAWLLRHPPPLPETVRFDAGLAARLRSPLAKLTDRLARPAESGEDEVRHGVLLLRAIDFAHRTARLVHGPDLAAAGVELLADRAARMLATRPSPEPSSEPFSEPSEPPVERPSGSGWPGFSRYSRKASLTPPAVPEPAPTSPGPPDPAARIAELTGPLDPAALARWIVPHLAEAGYEPGGWLHSEAPAGERLPAAVQALVAPAVDADRLARLRPEELAAADVGRGPDRVGLEVAVASATGRIAGDPRMRGPAVRHLLRLAVDANPQADPEPLVAGIFDRLAAGEPWNAGLLLQITEPAPEKLAPHLVPVALRHLADWLDDTDSARLAAALLKRIDFLPRRDAEGRERPRRAGVTDTQAQVLNLLAITGPGWPEQDEGLHRRAAELLMFADRAWAGLTADERRLIAPRVTVAAFAVAIAAEPAQRETVLRSRLPVVPVGSAWREAVPLGLEAALPLVGSVLRQNKHRLAGEVVIASTRAMLRPGELSAQALPDTGADVPRLPALPIGPALRWLVESEATAATSPFATRTSSGAEAGEKLAGHLMALVEAEIRAAPGPVDRVGLREFWEQALPGATLAADPFPLEDEEAGLIAGRVVSTGPADLRNRIRAALGYFTPNPRPTSQRPELPSSPIPIRTPPYGLARPRNLTPPHGVTPEDRVIEGQTVQPPREVEPRPEIGPLSELEPWRPDVSVPEPGEAEPLPDAELRRPRGAQRAVNRPGWQEWLRSVMRRD